MGLIEQTDQWAQASDETREAVRGMVESGAESMADFAHDKAWTDVKLRLLEARDGAIDAGEAVEQIPGAVRIDVSGAVKSMEQLKLEAEAAARAVKAAGGTQQLQTQFKRQTAAGLQRGIVNVPHDMPAFIHRGEMVLPAAAAAAIRGMIGSGQLTNGLRRQSSFRPNMAELVGPGGGGRTVVNQFVFHGPVYGDPGPFMRDVDLQLKRAGRRGILDED
jgi:hypothetical protein